MSFNRHWPNMFKVKPSNISRTYHLGGTSSQEEERKPEPKPSRWSPLPEQLEILESLFNSGMVNPKAEEIQMIKMQLQEYGQVGEANVFYWFQNKKSRTKRKQRNLQASEEKAKSPANTQTPLSSSGGGMHNEGASRAGNTNGISCPPDPFNTDQDNFKPQESLVTSAVTYSTSTIVHAHRGLGVNNTNATLIPVFINGIRFHAPMEPVNVRAAFGENANLFESSGQPVPLNGQGFTLQGLKEGAMYYLVYG